ncbi:SOX15_30 [Acanthosepion pharaonis]|uniref:Sex-determining region Y protein n=1 Tax=Acanthosepion pharaonis TaxID=158019 RepID=A0A812CW18_ACAPH|nr:SOX15_30 [Sepia pharaonis]
MFPGAPNSQISIYLGNIWRSMTWEQQKPFFEEAKRIRYRHQNDYPGYVHTLSALRDPDCEVNNEDNVERTIQFGDQASFDLQELWNLVEGNFSSTQNVDSQDCADAMSLMKMCDCEVEGQRSFNESTQLGDQPSLDLQELWNLVENSSPPPTQITDSQECETCTWMDVPCEKVVSVAASCEVLASNIVPMNPIEYTVSSTSWPVLDDTQCHDIHNEPLMESFPEHSMQLIVTHSPETLNASGGTILPKLNDNCRNSVERGCKISCEADNMEKWWQSPRDADLIAECDG